ncbi:MAG: choice-of-anchor Q domain-containing protein [Desulfobacterales bacterium]
MSLKQRFSVFVGCVLFLVFMAESASGAIFNVSDATGFSSALVTAAVNGEADTINVAAGTYDVSEPLVYAAASTETDTLTIQGAGAESTILRGDDCRIMVLTAYGDVTLEGVTFLYGRSSSGANGGGLAATVSDADITISHCVFQGNYADGQGGGAYIQCVGSTQGTITIDNNEFLLNRSRSSGGGFSAFGTTNTYYKLILTNNIFWGNQSQNGGGGASVLAGGYSYGSSVVSKNIFIYNFAADSGGGLEAGLGSYRSLSQYGGTVANNLFLNNSAADEGGGAYLDVNISGTAKVVNNTCIENGAALGGGFYFYLRDNTDTTGWDVTAHIGNNIVGGNSAGTGADIYINNEWLLGKCNIATVNLYNNDYPASGLYVVNTTTNYTATGNIDVDPIIVAYGDLASGSACIDAGSATNAPADDIHGEVRPNGLAVDIGADEFYDTDTDGLPDYWEDRYFAGSAEPGADPDEDGFTNLQEYEYGLDPLVPAYDASGQWDVDITSVDTDCPDMLIEDVTVTIDQFEDQITLTTDDQIFEGIFNGMDSTYFLSAQELDNGNTVTYTILFSLASPTSGTGTLLFSVTDASSNLLCDGSAEFTMSPHQDTPLPVPDDDDDDDNTCFISHLL